MRGLTTGFFHRGHHARMQQRDDGHEHQHRAHRRTAHAVPGVATLPPEHRPASFACAYHRPPMQPLTAPVRAHGRLDARSHQRSSRHCGSRAERREPPLWGTPGVPAAERFHPHPA